MVGKGNPPAAADSSTSPATETGGHNSSRASSALSAVSVVLILLYLFWRFLWQCKKHAAGNTNATVETTSGSSSASRPPSCSSRTACRAGPEARHETPSSSFPVFVHLAAPGAEKAECAVCLVEFRDGETGQLVPGCGHGFHAECIATWLQVNSTCPLCRAAVTTKQRIGEAPIL